MALRRAFGLSFASLKLLELRSTSALKAQQIHSQSVKTCSNSEELPADQHFILDLAHFKAGLSSLPVAMQSDAWLRQS
jgi:hypothetical protein